MIPIKSRNKAERIAQIFVIVFRFMFLSSVNEKPTSFCPPNFRVERTPGHRLIQARKYFLDDLARWYLRLQTMQRLIQPHLCPSHKNELSYHAFGSEQIL